MTLPSLKSENVDLYFDPETNEVMFARRVYVQNQFGSDVIKHEISLPLKALESILAWARGEAKWPD